MATNNLEQYVGVLRAKYGYGGMSRIASAIGMSLSAFTRGVKNGTLSVENCLRLADLTGNSAGMILRLAGKEDMAAVCDRLNDRLARGRALSRAVQEVAQKIEDLADSPDKQDLVIRFVEAFHRLNRRQRRQRKKQPDLQPSEVST